MLINGRYQCIARIGTAEYGLEDLPSTPLNALRDQINHELSRRNRNAVEAEETAARSEDLLWVYTYPSRRHAHRVVRVLAEKMDRSVMPGINVFAHANGQLIVALQFDVESTRAQRCSAALFVNGGNRLKTTLDELLEHKDEFAAYFLGDGAAAYLASQY